MKRRKRGSWFMLTVRGLGALGLFAALLGGLGARATPGFSLRQTSQRVFDNPASIKQLLFNTPDRTLQVCLWLLVVGMLLAAVSLLVQAAAGLGKLAGRRNVTGSNAAVQSALVVALLIAVNVLSFDHYRRVDCTGRRVTWSGWRPGFALSNKFRPQFTLPPTVAQDLKQLRGETTVVVYQRHKTFGQLSDKPDAFDYAAERKVVEKVRDLVQLFREFGPQFKVELLDVEDEGYDDHLDRITKNNPALKKAIETAPDNSILFHTHRDVTGPDGAKEQRESVQRLSFNDFYQLDKSESRKEKDLVLLPQGVESFARRVLAIEEKRPKVGIAVIHEWLTSEGYREFAMTGLRKTLELNGFEVTDVVLKKWGEGEPTPAVSTLHESQLERLEEELAEYDAIIAVNRGELRAVGGVLEKLKSNITLDELNRELAPMLRGQRMNEESRRRNVIALEPQIEALREILGQQEKERGETLKQLEEVPGQERAGEYRRMTDVKAKFEKLLSDVDLLIVPRMTLRNVAMGEGVPARLHRLDDGQLAAIKDFMKAGKPVFGMFGPTNEAANRRMPATPTTPDNLELLFAQLGIVFGNQTILFNSEAKAFSQRRVSLFATGGEVEIPGVFFERPKARGRGDLATEPETRAKPNPIAQSMKIIAGATGSADKIEKLSVRHPRPVYFLPLRGANPSVAEFLYSDPDSWNESDPFPTREKSPRFEPAKPDDPQRGTREAEQRGPFPIGVAIETTVPVEWRESASSAVKGALLTADGSGSPSSAAYTVAAQSLVSADRYAASKDATRLRVAAIGHGDVFNGLDLGPAKQQLLLHTCNWLLGRDERLPSAEQAAWKFPRVELSPRRAKFWQLGTMIALPAAFAFLGTVVLLVRKYR